MKRVLMLAPYFLPRRRVGALRPFRFAAHLREHGWVPTVVTLGAPGQRLTPREAALLEGVRVHELAPPFDRTTRGESSHRVAKPPEAGATERRDAPAQTTRATIADRVVAAVDGQFPVDTWWPLLRARRAEMRALIADVRPDVVWATGDPWSSLVTGAALAHEAGLPFVADYRDPWTLCDVRTRGRGALARRLDRRIERTMLGRARAVVFSAARTEARYHAHYGEALPPTHTIYNSFDPALYRDPVGEAAGERTHRGRPRGARLVLGFFGRFRALSPASVVVDALAALERRHPQMAGRVEIVSFGPLNEQDAAYARRHGVLDAFRTHAPVPIEEALGVLRAFDVLLLSTDPGRDEIIPAKLLDYLAAGRPVLSLSPNPEVSEILRRTGVGQQVVPGDAEAAADVLAACVRALEEAAPLPIPFAPDVEAIAGFSADRATAQLVAVLDAAAG